ncbi:MAG: DUF6159 family protein [Mycobacterium sp.]
MAKASWAVLKDQPTLAVFPVISAVAAVLLSLLLLIPAVLGFVTAAGLGASDKGLEAVGFVALFAWYFVCTFAVIFCNAALISCALEKFAGQPTSVRSGFAAAWRRLPQILGWSLLASTVGVLLQLLQSVLREKAGALGDVVTGLGQGVWGVATYFAVPVVVTEGLGPIAAVKRSSALLRKTWGESLTGAAGLNLILFLFLLPIFAIGGLLWASGASGAVVPLVTLCAVYAVVLTVIFTALGSIFRAGVYRYATTGDAPGHMDTDLLQSAFRSR